MTDHDLLVQLTRIDERATKALEKQADHEASCDRRYGEIINTQNSTLALIQSLQSRWFWAATGLIGVLLSLTGYLLINGRPWG